VEGGAPPGSKNRKGHGAGGSHKGAGRKSVEQKAYEVAESKAMEERREHRRIANRAQAEANKAEFERKRQEAKRKMEEEALKRLRETAFDQRVRDESWVDAEVIRHDDDMMSYDDDADDIPNPVNDDVPNVNASDDEVEDYEMEDEGKGATKQRRARIRAAYMPPKDSPIGKVLQATQDKISKAGPFSNICQMWIPPGDDPLACTLVAGPDKYYHNELWQFIWRPFQQFSKHVQLKNIGCVHRCDSGNLKLKGMRWRPNFKGDEIVWLLHDRIECKCCGRCTSTIDPCFLALMPTIVVERRPFITTASGPGIQVSAKQDLKFNGAKVFNNAHITESFVQAAFSAKRFLLILQNSRNIFKPC